MEEIKEGSCSTNSKKCCTKGIIIIVICSLMCFFLGYYFGNKANSNINRAVGSGINRPFYPRQPRNIPNKIPNIPNIKRPPSIPNIPKQQPPRINAPQDIQEQNKQNIQKPDTKKQNKK